MIVRVKHLLYIILFIILGYNLYNCHFILHWNILDKSLWEEFRIVLGATTIIVIIGLLLVVIIPKYSEYPIYTYKKKK